MNQLSVPLDKLPDQYLACLPLGLLALLLLLLYLREPRFTSRFNRLKRRLLELAIHPNCLDKTDATSRILLMMQALAEVGDARIRSNVERKLWKKLCRLPAELLDELDELVRCEHTRANDMRLQQWLTKPLTNLCDTFLGEGALEKRMLSLINRYRSALEHGSGYHVEQQWLPYTALIAAFHEIGPAKYQMAYPFRLFIEQSGALVLLDGELHRLVRVYEFREPNQRVLWREAELFCYRTGEIRYLSLEEDRVYLGLKQLPSTTIAASKVQDDERTLIIEQSRFVSVEDQRLWAGLYEPTPGFDTYRQTVVLEVCFGSADTGYKQVLLTRWEEPGGHRLSHLKTADGVEILTKEAPIGRDVDERLSVLLPRGSQP